MGSFQNIVAIQDIVKFFINPLWYLLLGIVVLIFLKKQRFRLGALLFLYAYLISITFSGYIFSRIWRVDDTFDPHITYDAAVVLAGFSDDSWHLEREGLPYIPDDFFSSSDESDRILAGIHFVKAGHAKLLLVGEWFSESWKYGVHSTYDEGIFARRLALRMGLRDEQIHLYGKVRRTLNEAEGVKRYVENHRPGKILLITSESHMRRAQALFHKQGIHPDTFSVNREKGIVWESFVPGVAGLEKTRAYLHEVVGYAGYVLKGSI